MSEVIGHSDFLVVRASALSDPLNRFLQSASDHLDLGGGTMVARWAIGAEEPGSSGFDGSSLRPSTIMCGTPVSARTGVSAMSLAERGDFDDLIGAFAVLRLHADGSLDITNDSFGVQALYWLDEDGIQAVGTRIDLVVAAFESYVGRRAHRNHDAALAVAARGLAFGVDTAFDSIQLVEFGARVVMEAGDGLRQVGWWRAPWDVALRESADVDGLVEEAIDRQIAGLRAISAHSSDPVEVDLTGGKDSRLVLALCATAGILDEVLFVTRGGIDHPDVVVGTHVAAELALNHQRSPWEGPRDSWDREFVIRAGYVAGRAGLFADPRERIGRSWRVPGFVGETWRTNYPRQQLDDSLDTIVERERQHLRRRACYIREPAFADVLDRATQQLRDIATTVRVSDVVDAQYILDRCRTWLGSRVRSFDRTYLALYAPDMASLAFSLGLRARLDESIRTAVMRRSPVSSSQMPFTKLLERGATLSEVSPTLDQQRAARGEKVPWPPWTRSYRDYREVRQRILEGMDGPPVERWTAMRELLLADGSDHPVYEFVNFEAVRADVEAGPTIGRSRDVWLCDVLAAKLQLASI